MSLTGKQKNFARNIVNGMAKGEAAIEAKYSKASANSIASENLSKPKIKAYIKELEEERDALINRQFGHAAGMAVKELVKVLTDDDTPPQVKTNTAKILLDYAGFKPTDKQEVENKGDLGIKVVWADDDDAS